MRYQLTCVVHNGYTPGLERSLPSVDQADPIIHPPVHQFGRVVVHFEDLHVQSVREVVREDLLVALVAQRTDDAVGLGQRAEACSGSA
jgi:hypothetical protein